MSQHVKSNFLSAGDQPVSREARVEFAALTLVRLVVDSKKDVTRIPAAQQQEVRGVFRSQCVG